MEKKSPSNKPPAQCQIEGCQKPRKVGGIGLCPDCERIAHVVVHVMKMVKQGEAQAKKEREQAPKLIVPHRYAQQRK